MAYTRGKIAVITGAGSGIGRSLAQQLNQEGCEIYLSDINPAALEETLGLLEREDIPAHTCVLDVADKAAYQEWITRAGEELGGIDIFVPNVSAGGGNMSEEGWEANFNIDDWPNPKRA